MCLRPSARRSAPSIEVMGAVTVGRLRLRPITFSLGENLKRRGGDLGVGVRLIIQMIRCDCAKVEFKFIIFYELLTEHFWPSIVVKNLLSPRGKIHSSRELETIHSSAIKGSTDS
jgi:hypothetical protein